MSETKKINMLPVNRVIKSGDNDASLVKSWDSHTSEGLSYSQKTVTTISGSNIKTDNAKEQSFGSSITPSVSGNPYGKDGSLINVQTKTSTYFYTLYWTGDKNHTNFSRGADVSLSTKSTFMQNVVGFATLLSSKPTGSSPEGDGCGTSRDHRIILCYVDGNNKFRMLDCCKGDAIKKGYQRWDSNPGASDGDKPFSYVLSSADEAKVIDGNWLFLGFITNSTHTKTCGGSNKQKNCSSRLSRFTPIVKESKSSNYSTSGEKLYQVVPSINSTLSEVRSGKFSVKNVG